MPMPAAGIPLKRLTDVYDSLPSSTRATSDSRTTAPLPSDLRIISLNCSTVRSRLREVTVALSAWPSTAGSEPSEPEETSAFCDWIALVTSDGIRRSEEHTSELQSIMRISYDVF